MNVVRMVAGLVFLLWIPACGENRSDPANLIQGTFQAVQKCMAETPEGSSPGGVPEAPEAREAGSGGGLASLGRVVAVLLVVLGLLWVFLSFLKRLLTPKGPRETDGVRVLSRLALSPKSRVYLLEAGGSRVLVGEAGGELRTLHTFPFREEPGPEVEAVPGEGPREEESVFAISLEEDREELDRMDFLQKLSVGVRGLRQRKSSLS